MKPTTTQYVGIDLHQATSSICIRDVDGRITQQTVLQTSASAIRGLIRSLDGEILVTFEEGTQSQWLYDVLRDDAKVLVCDPRHNHSMKGNKSDKVDAERLSDLLRAGMLRPVYHDIHSVRDLRELVRSYTTLVKDATRIMLRLKALYRARTIATTRRRDEVRGSRESTRPRHGSAPSACSSNSTTSRSSGRRQNERCSTKRDTIPRSSCSNRSRTSVLSAPPKSCQSWRRRTGSAPSVNSGRTRVSPSSHAARPTTK
jgi:hypothetical protein